MAHHPTTSVITSPASQGENIAIIPAMIIRMPSAMDQPEARFTSRTASAITPPFCRWAQAETRGPQRGRRWRDGCRRIAGAEAEQRNETLLAKLCGEIR